MADDATTIKIDEALAVSLKAVAEANGESLDDFVRHALEIFANQDTDWDELNRIADETLANGDGIPAEELAPWLRGWGRPDGPPRPR